ncbi:SDR family NAD(P)-dependent oxidoreductase [Mycolicibacterium sp. P9-22]|uniref:SDR family oxidoreductase n=1 Tax=Mycolicibacterium sp. P9-22 TaxID=2024613 RepID=UPI0011EEE503|nr:SDR family NAD(P)-dependent oxidoreductase [Mycolicibacterium sp. P9-22]KAA0119953.1 SDR family oxidoreductase [Mycolicibacterium sp. P9-22]
MPDKAPTLSTAVAHDGRLAGKRVLITGTGGGQGAVAQELFCNHGAHVIGCDVRPGAAAATAAVLSAQGLSAEGHDIDLADPTAARRWVQNSISTLGGIDVLYNNASAAAVAPFSEMTLDQWRFTISNELEIVFTVTSAAWPALLENGGSVINIASSVGSIGLQAFGFAAHGAAKGGVLALTRQLAAEGAPHRVRVNAITPGFIATPGTSAIPQAARDYVTKWVNLLDDPIEPIDVAYCALYLASDESRSVTGADLAVDAGSTAGRPA